MLLVCSIINGLAMYHAEPVTAKQMDGIISQQQVNIL